MRKENAFAIRPPGMLIPIVPRRVLPLVPFGITISQRATEPMNRARVFTTFVPIRAAHGLRVRLVQIDTPEVYGGYECYGPAARGHR